MTRHELSATFAIASWEEVPFDDVDGAKLTRADVRKDYSGDVEATSTTTWLMAYAPEGTATFVGLERIVGTFGGHAGSLVLRHVGEFRDGAATATLTVVGGTEALVETSGTGSLVADPAGSIELGLVIGS